MTIFATWALGTAISDDGEFNWRSIRLQEAKFLHVVGPFRRHIPGFADLAALDQILCRQVLENELEEFVGGEDSRNSRLICATAAAIAAVLATHGGLVFCALRMWVQVRSMKPVLPCPAVDGRAQRPEAAR
jgi:hypothetical protein